MLSATTKNRVFAHDRINTGRQEELDLAKFVVICCLAYTHCIIECTPEAELVSGIPYLFDSIIGGPLGAPMFLLAMGVGMAYTRKNTPRDLVRRAILLGGVNYGLNICRFLLPSFIGYLFSGDHERFLVPLPYTVLGNDVLLFVSFALLLMALFIKLHLSDAAIFGLSAVASVLGTFLAGTDTGSPLGNILLGYLIGTEDAAGLVHSYFPLLNWLIVPVSGYLFGKRLLYVKDKDRFYGILSVICIPLTVVYFTIGIKNGLGMFGEGQLCYYHITTPDVMAALCSVLSCLGIYHLIVPHLPKKAKTAIRSVSQNVTSVYCVHWGLVTFSINVILYLWRGTQELPVALTLLLATGICFASILLAQMRSNYKEQRAVRKVHDEAKKA